MAIIIYPARIATDGEDFEGEETADSLCLPADEEAQATGPIRYELNVQLAGRELIVTGAVAARIRFACSRCAMPFESDVRDGAFFYEQEVEDLHSPIDLTGEVRESIILAFPTYPVCRSACRGLCPRCGANRNREQCGCTETTEPMGSVFDSLDVRERTEHGRT